MFERGLNLGRILVFFPRPTPPRELSRDVFERRTSTGSGPFSFMGQGSGVGQICGQIDSIRIKTLSNTYLVASSRILKEKTPLPVDVRRSKTALVKLPNIAYYCWTCLRISATNRGKSLVLVMG